MAGYYRWFIQNYGTIVAPSCDCSRKDGFTWLLEATMAFDDLKQALSTAPVLQHLDIDKPFLVYCDAFGSKFKAVLHQGDSAIAFFSRPFVARHLKFAAYERELIGLVQAVRHWRPFLWGQHFVMRTNHYALKFMLDQRLSTVPQHQWVSKLFSYDFNVEGCPGHLNTVADALSCHGDDNASLSALTGPSFWLYDDRRHELQVDDTLRAFHDTVVADRDAPWRVVDGLILRGTRVFVPISSPSLPAVLQLAHSLAMRTSGKHCTASVKNSSSIMIPGWCASSCMPARRANTTRPMPCTWPASYNLSTYHHRFGLTSPWISLKACRVSTARASS